MKKATSKPSANVQTRSVRHSLRIALGAVTFAAALGAALPAAIAAEGGTPAVAACAAAFGASAERPFVELKRELQANLQARPPLEQRAFAIAQAALYFIDYPHAAPIFAEYLLGQKQITIAPPPPTRAQKSFPTFRKWFGVAEPEAAPQVEFARLYDINPFGGGAHQEAFADFLAAQDFLARDPAPWSYEKLAAVHSLVMKGGIEALPEAYRGVCRDCPVTGNATGVRALGAAQVEHINANPYLSFVSTGQNGNLFTGQIIYPTPARIKAESLNRLQSAAPAVVARVLDFQARVKSQPAARDPQLERDLVQALIRERFTWFLEEKGRLGSSDHAAFTHLMAQFSRDVVSIHPFMNGNGRSTRLMIGDLFEKFGMAPPRFLDVDEDLEGSPEAWETELRQGVENSARLYADLADRALLDLPFELSPELILPTLARVVKIDKKAGNARVTDEAYRSATLDARQFQAYVRQRFTADPSLVARFRAGPLLVTRELSEAFLAWTRLNRVDYLHEKDGLREIGLNFVDPDFARLFGKSLAANPVAWRKKMDLWYTDEIMYRGISYQSQAVTDVEIRGMFAAFHPQMLSMEVNRQLGGRATPEAKRAAILADFERYNRDLLQGTVSDMMRDHSETGPMYRTSYGYSTSKKESVAKAFAMGAMVIADYGKQGDFQHLLKSRIIMGARRAKKDVDLTRLHQIDPKFSYAYGRQVEITGVGGADPDSIVIVKEVGADGETLRSFVRNPARPNEVWVVRGNFEVGVGAPPADRLLATWSLMVP